LSRATSSTLFPYTTLFRSYRCGDLNVSLIRTAKGRVITLEHNVSTPQPYDRINLIAGTKGIFRDYPPRIYIDGAKREEFGPIDRSEEHTSELQSRGHLVCR